MFNKNFLQSVANSLATTPEPPKFWFYVPFENEQRQFTGAVVIESQDELSACFDVMKVKDTVGKPRVPDRAKIPDDQLPGESLRGRWLTEDEVRRIWRAATQLKPNDGEYQ